MTATIPSDASIHSADEEYLERHGVKETMAKLLQDIIMTKPADPIQFMVDFLSMEDPNDAKQDKYGLSVYRRGKLLDIFKQMDKNNSGAVDFKEIKEHSSKYGGAALSEAELREVFRDFDTSGDHQIDSNEFLAFFSRSVKNMSNDEFDQMVSEMMD